LFIVGGNAADKRFYRLVMPITVKDGEIVDVHNKSGIPTFPIQNVEGLIALHLPPVVKDALEHYNYVTEPNHMMIYPDHPDYNGCLISFNIKAGPLKVFLDRDQVPKAYADTIMFGYKRFEAIKPVKFVETTNKDEADIVTVYIPNSEMMQSELKDNFTSKDIWKLNKQYVYLYKTLNLKDVEVTATHELTHGFGHYRDNGHSPFLNDMFGVSYNYVTGVLSDRDILLMKIITYPRPNTDLTSLRKNTKYD